MSEKEENLGSFALTSEISCKSWKVWWKDTCHLFISHSVPRSYFYITTFNFSIKGVKLNPFWDHSVLSLSLPWICSIFSSSCFFLLSRSRSEIITRVFEITRVSCVTVHCWVMGWHPKRRLCLTDWRCLTFVIVCINKNQQRGKSSCLPLFKKVQ